MGLDRTILDVTPTTVREACGVMARAFADDPVVRWVQPRRLQAADVLLFRAMYASMHGAPGSAHLVRDRGVAVGAAFWDPPGYEPPPVMQLLALPPLALAVRTGSVRGARLVMRMLELRPAEPHWYLSTLGAVTPGRGIGTALLRHGLDRVEGPAYLESSNPRNLPLYERFGFEVTGEVSIAGSPPLAAMYRPG
ncbi:GNAT family N-acetyltransferase [Tsukamurella sp. 8F]|uniref:GNAT family N-acetyltransferase n=1 Tax=unclassified Tsukamurella TaxID=2633480 RepID=UPI0023B9A943|nr:MULTISPECIES: GNAT family N-acetyltransferase [unclassified Tsukamurella]MDF0530103.1 GNAT family N-acetyltransferase [Tsukamurella sp. 8J]MDF0586421.1 GNAT family N-acetyltransferase [Tsukamurella sp. 8F]